MTLTHPHRLVMDEEMGRIRQAIRLMGEQVRAAIGLAVNGLMSDDLEASARAIAGDAEVNRLQLEARNICFTVILTQAPVARDLREIMGLFHMAAELERMGDHCVSIAKIARRVAESAPLPQPVDLAKLGDLCADQLRDMLDALVRRDADKARLVAARDDRIDRVYHRLFDELVQAMADSSQSCYRATNLIFVAHHLERIGDRVTNLAEDLVFLETGMTEELD